MRKFKGNRGSILTATVMGTAVITTVAAGLYSMTLTDAAVTKRYENSMKAFFAAEAGAAEMMDILKDNWFDKDDSDSYPSGSMNNGSYDVTVTQPDGRVVITSVGTVGNISRRVVIEVEWPAMQAFATGIFGNGNVQIEGASYVASEVRSNANIQVEDLSTLAGNATAVGVVQESGWGTITGTETEGAAPLEFPIFDFNYYYNLAQSGGLYYSSSQTFSNRTLNPGNGVIYVNGNVTLSGLCIINGAIVATGSITGSGIYTINDQGAYPALMSRDGNIVLTGIYNLDGMVYTKNGNVTISGISSIQGQIVSYGNVNFTGITGSSLDVPEEVPPGLDSDSSPLKKLTYHE